MINPRWKLQKDEMTAETINRIKTFPMIEKTDHKRQKQEQHSKSLQAVSNSDAFRKVPSVT
eukprot:2987027-Amphidinium_carterae.1